MIKPLDPKNLTAQLDYEASGNPPGAHPRSAVGNFFPGLEFNFLSVWKRVFVGIELNESSGQVLAVDPAAPDPLKQVMGLFLIEVEGRSTIAKVTGPGVPTGTDAPVVFLEWGNLLADVHLRLGGTSQTAACVFADLSDDPPRILPPIQLAVRRLFDPGTVVISTEAVEPGELTQSLCSPWQTDFIGCACYYWAANRPDYINIWEEADGSHGGGHNWLNAEREMRPDPKQPGTSKPFYTLEEGKVLKHEDIMRPGDWEAKLRFVIGGKDE